MLQYFKPLLLAGLLVASTGLSAQETTPTPETAAPATSDLDMGTVIDEENAVGTPYIRETFGDWSLRCLRAEKGQDDPCQLYQLLNDADGNSVAEISMFPLPEGGRAAAGATIVVPLETLLTEQLQISVDGSAARRYPFTFCNRAGCVSRVGFTQDEIDQFKQGNKATLRMVPAAAPEEEVVLDISLIGFTAGFNGSEN
tara:strand:+ start:8273 stop:8869 length:597 start_codon:yes stop_codon:yes gene_type:complete